MTNGESWTKTENTYIILLLIFNIKLGDAKPGKLEILGLKGEISSTQYGENIHLEGIIAILCKEM